MKPRALDLAAAVTGEAANELDSALKRIEHCLSQLTEDQLWWRPQDSMNSIANLILHLSGNVRQWITAGIGGAKDTRNRPKEFSEKGPIAKDELLRRLSLAVSEAIAALGRASEADLLECRRIQGFEVTGIEAVFGSVAHFRGHTQEIIHMTRCQLGDDYQFAFIPNTPEQGAPGE